MGKGKIFRSASCAGDGRRHEFSGRSQLRRIDLRHATDVAVLEGAPTCPFHHFADALLLGRGNAPCGRKELVPEPNNSVPPARGTEVYVKAVGREEERN